MVEEDKLLIVQYKWLLDIIERIDEVLAQNPDKSNSHEKLDQIHYLIKQAKKVEREE